MGTVIETARPTARGNETRQRILAKALGEPQVPASQVLLMRSYAKLLFAPAA